MNCVAILSARGASYNLEVLFRNKPSYDIRYVIAIDNRICTDVDAVKQLCNKYNVTNYEILESNEIFTKFKHDIDLTTYEFFNSYTMSLNILVQWYLLKHGNYNKVLFLDDDVILNNDIEKIFENNKSMFYVYRLSAGALTYDECSKTALKVHTAFGNIFDFKVTPENYKQTVIETHINGGQRLYCSADVDIDKYEMYLKRFFENQDLFEIWSKRRNHCSWYIDERFEGYFAWKTNIFNNDMPMYAYVENRNPLNLKNGILNRMPKYTKINKAIWHNATCGKKQVWIDTLLKHSLIK